MAAFVLASHRAGARGFWFDEAYTARLAELGFGRALRGALQDVHPPLWTLVEWAFHRLPLEPTLALRLPSALAFSALVLLLSRRHLLAGLALLFHLPLLDLAAQGRSYLALTLALVLLSRLVERSWWIAAGLTAAIAACLHGAGMALAAVVALASLPRVRPRLSHAVRFLAAFIVPSLAWIAPWSAVARVYVERPFYETSTLEQWTTISDGAVGLPGLALAAAICPPWRSSAGRAAIGVVLTLFVAERLGVPMELRKLGILVAPLMLAGLPPGARGRLAAAIVAVAFVLSNRRIDARPDLEEAALRIEALPRMPVGGMFAGELRHSVRAPGPIWLPREPAPAAARIAEILGADTPCIAAVQLWNHAPDQELPVGVRLVAWGHSPTLDLRVYGTDACVLAPMPEGWTAGHPCRDPQMREWLCAGGDSQRVPPPS